jgi:hypothetical protein
VSTTSRAVRARARDNRNAKKRWDTDVDFRQRETRACGRNDAVREQHQHPRESDRRTIHRRDERLFEIDHGAKAFADGIAAARGKRLALDAVRVFDVDAR